MYTYDSMNRLLTVTEPSGNVTTYTYDSQNRLTSKIAGSVTTSYTYDANGNELTETTNGVVTTNSYDVWNNLTKTVKGSVSVANTYNGDGLRVKKVSGSTTTQYVYEYDKVILELDGSGNQKASNVYGKKLLSRVESGTPTYYLYNGHGDVTTILNASGTVIAGYYYDAFGVQLDVSGNVSNPYRYSGYVYDSETNLYYLNARFYSAETARFLQEDSYRGNIGDPLSLNLYAYVCYNPLIYRDPTGHWMEGDDKLPQEARDKIAGYTATWEKYNAIYKDTSNSESKRNAAKAVMDAAHEAANAVRAQYATQTPATPTPTPNPKPTDKPVSNGNSSSGSSGSSTNNNSGISQGATETYPPTQQPSQGNKENATLPTQPTPIMQQITITINDINPTMTEKDIKWDIRGLESVDKIPSVGEVIAFVVMVLGAAGSMVTTTINLIGDGVTSVAELVEMNMPSVYSAVESNVNSFLNNPLTLPGVIKLSFEHLLGNQSAQSPSSQSAEKSLMIGDETVELTGKNIVGTNYDKVKPTQDWIDMQQVNDYVKRLKMGEKLSPIEIYEIPGKGYFIQDGHHRFVASQITGIPVEVKVVPGGGPVGLPDWTEVLP